MRRREFISATGLAFAGMAVSAKASKGRLKLIAHVGCLNTDDACELARYAAKIGIDWVSSVAPVYFGQNFDARCSSRTRTSRRTSRS